LRGEMSFFYDGNPIQNPPLEILKSGSERIIRFIDEYIASQKDDIEDYENAELKMVIVGNPNTGKTHLAHYLKSNFKSLPVNNASTHGLIHLSYPYKTKSKKSIRLNLLDFGGQEYYHDTHHFFFTDDTIYLMLWNQRSNHYGTLEDDRYQEKGENYALEKYQCYALSYWLDSIAQLRSNQKARRQVAAIATIENKTAQQDLVLPSTPAMSEEERPILLIETWRDKRYQSMPALNQTRDYDHLIHSFNSIELHRHTGKLIKRGVQGFRENLDEAIDLMVLGKWPGYMKFIVEVFREINTGTGAVFTTYPVLNNLFISLEDATDLFNTIIRNQGKTYKYKYDDQKAQDVLHFLANRGYIIYFDDELVCIKPQELTNKIYEILDRSLKDEAIISKEELSNKANSSDIVKIMERQKLIIPHPTEESYILPQYLPGHVSEDIKMFLATFQDPFLVYEMAGFVQRHIVHDILFRFRVNILLSNNKPYMWQNGVVLSATANGKQLIKIEFDQKELHRRISVSVNQQKPDFEFMQAVMNILDEALQNKKYTKLVSTPGRSLVSYDRLHELAAASINQLELEDKSVVRVSDYKIWLKGDLRNAAMKKVFISYSSKESLFMHRLSTHLELLKSEGSIDYWHDRMIEPGTKWDDTIKKQLEESDVYICLLSADFLATPYVREVEIPAIKQQVAQNKEKKLLPILLNSCYWSKLFLEEQMLHDPEIKENKTILSVQDADNDDAWMKYIKKF
ncbi:MAG: TIR domain-containing protein, partial [Flavobacteriales bacterium]|nr:TIR domain-containing protein [Flavobacteriales bacterium]